MNIIMTGVYEQEQNISSFVFPLCIHLHPDSITTLGKYTSMPEIMLAQCNFVRTANIGPTHILQDIASMLGQHLYTFAQQ